MSGKRNPLGILMPKTSQDPAAIKWGESGAEYVCESTGERRCDLLRSFMDPEGIHDIAAGNASKMSFFILFPKTEISNC